MLKIIFHSFFILFLAIPAVWAAPPKDDSNAADANRNLEGQVNSVSQLSDIKPSDWAFQALQSLVERYGCIAGYPDATYRGNRALSRYEFAAGLNACLDRVNELIAVGTNDLVKKEDLAVLQNLQTEFAAELTTLRGRVDTLEAHTATLEAQQFSTTTRLNAQIITAVSDTFGNRVGGRGNLPGILFGIPPRVSNSDVRQDRDNAYHIEAFYRYRLNDNISVTPGFWMILNPENDSRNDTQYVGVIRTTFDF
ncbi:carbohydrate porin [Nostoc sp. CCCryo 231-06]|nr:carbohydrate porin [Nostoc sp. CCCryo 231-06]